jgi:signal peptidase II
VQSLPECLDPGGGVRDIVDQTGPEEMNIGKPRNSIWKLALIAGCVIILDQVTKLIIIKTLPLYDKITVIPGVFDIVHYLNPGGAFGLLAGVSSNFRHLFFIVVAILALGLVFYFYRSTPVTHRFLSVAFSMIFGGAVGNLIDRFRFGRVVDFLDFYVKNWHWPAFNVADSAITVGIGIFIFHLLFGKMPDEMISKK